MSTSPRSRQEVGQVEVETRQCRDLGLVCHYEEQETWGSWAFCPISWGWSLKVDEIIFTDKELADLNNAWLIGICKPLPVNRRLNVWLAPLGRGP